MSTMTHQYFATWFLSADEIAEILARNKSVITSQNQTLNDIVVSNKNSEIEYVKLEKSTFIAHILIINDVSKVSLVSSKNLGVTGSTVSQIVSDTNAVAGINAGGFIDIGGKGTGATPYGLVIENGEKISGSDTEKYSVVGIDEDNKLIMNNSISYNELKKLYNLKCAVSFGPVVVVNGEGTIKSGNGGMGIQPRTAIGQRKDGSIIFLVIDGRSLESLGGTLKDVQDIMLEYNAYNAFNLDGGSSATMVFNGKVVNNPSDILGERYVPNAFVVMGD